MSNINYDLGIPVGILTCLNLLFFWLNWRRHKKSRPLPETQRQALERSVLLQNAYNEIAHKMLMASRRQTTALEAIADTLKVLTKPDVTMIVERLMEEQVTKVLTEAVQKRLDQLEEKDDPVPENEDLNEILRDHIDSLGRDYGTSTVDALTSEAIQERIEQLTRNDPEQERDRGDGGAVPAGTGV